MPGTMPMTDQTPPLEGAPLIAPSSTDHPLYDQIVEACRTVYDPEIPVDIVNLGLVYRCEIKPLGNGERSIEIDMTLTAPGCGMGPFIVADAEEKGAIIPTVADVKVELVFDPPWNVGMMTDEARLQTGLM